MGCAKNRPPPQIEVEESTINAAPIQDAIANAPQQDALPQDAPKYPEEVAKSFIVECLQSGGSDELCQCTLERIESSMPYEKYLKANEEYGPEYNELVEKITIIGMDCLPKEELHQRLMAGCLNSNSKQYCDCYMNSFLGQLTLEELKTSILQIGEGALPPKYLSAQETAQIQCEKIE
jgi:hypothetical protein